jgi:hypothetical protein
MKFHMKIIYFYFYILLKYMDTQYPDSNAGHLSNTSVLFHCRTRTYTVPKRLSESIRKGAGAT